MATPIDCRGCGTRHDPLLRCPIPVVAGGRRRGIEVKPFKAVGFVDGGDGVLLTSVAHGPGEIERVAAGILGMVKRGIKPERLAEARAVVEGKVEGDPRRRAAILVVEELLREFGVSPVEAGMGERIVDESRAAYMREYRKGRRG